MESKLTSITDYTNEGFNVTIKSGKIKSYASVNVEYSYNKKGGLYPTDNYFVYYLHPKFGSCHFTIVMDEEDSLKAVDGPEWLDKKIIPEIINAINFRKN